MSTITSPRRHDLKRRLGLATLGAVLSLIALGITPATARTDPTVAQEPFLCTTEYNGLGQPTIDNHDKRGTPVYPTTGSGTPDRTQDPLGWSEQCQAPARVQYRYRTTSGSWADLTPGTSTLPANAASLAVGDLIGADAMDLGGATSIPYVIRYETGTLPGTRTIYSVAMLVPLSEVTANPGPGGPWDDSYWNGRLVFSFDGGVGIGHSQGNLSGRNSQLDEALRLGHAVVYSTLNRTATHYNLMLGGRAATEVKAHFVAEHGAPLYTTGIGGSGGGIQQYVYAQNIPDLLDVLIPQYAYPDMTTQTINVGDCELLEHYMDVLDADNPRWSNWDNRKILEGQNTIEGFTSSWQARMGKTGSSECIEGWRGATPLAMNPTFGLAVGEDQVILPYAGELVAKISAGEPAVPDDFPDLGRLLRTSPDPDDWVEWTHWADVAEVYGVDPDTGFARVPWDNVGVQYGLRAVANGTITPAEFLKLNAEIGSWKPTTEQTPESCGMVEAMTDATLATFAQMIGMCSGSETDASSARQMNFSTDIDHPAPRAEGDVAAITAAFTSGLEFDGKLPADVPVIDVRHYLEDELDMHNAHQSFVTRQRIINAQGNADNQLIWFLDARPGVDDTATDALFRDGFTLVDEWMANLRAHPGATAAETKPTGAVDRCWATDGTPIASGDHVWDGANELVLSGEGAWTDHAPTEVDGVTVGPCAAAFPLHSTSRVIAGGPITNDVYKCHLKSVEQSIADGDYGDWVPDATQQTLLDKIFPTGVCDYSLRSVGYPEQAPVDPTTTTTTVTTTNPPDTTGPGADENVPAVPSTTMATDPGGIDRDTTGDEALARTGAEIGGLLSLGVVLVAAGIVTTTASRRRRHTG